jgi:hypothetical protein
MYLIAKPSDPFSTQHKPQGTRDYWLTFGGVPNGLEGFSDADWASQDHRHSISGYGLLINGGAISWSSNKQPIIALLSTEAEYIAIMHVLKELIWTRLSLAEIARPLKAPTVIYCDNQSAIDLTKTLQFHARTKHISIRYHFIREHIHNNSIIIPYCNTNEMAADIFTKPLPKPKIERFAAMLGLGLRSA